MRIRGILAEAWQAALLWIHTRPDEVPAAIVDTIAIPRLLLLKVIEILDATYDLPEDQQSDDLRSLIAQLKELND